AYRQELRIAEPIMEPSVVPVGPALTKEVTSMQTNIASKNGASRRMLVIGLDCAAPELVFDAWRADLPTINRLMSQGAYGKLESTIPAITVPAWSCMMNGRVPGQLVFYGYRYRAYNTYERMTVGNSKVVTYPLAGQ